MRRGKGKYPPDWKQIAERIKAQAGYKCERCGHPNDRKSGHVLTVHHLDLQKNNCEDWNLAALCQRCHLSIQSKVVMAQEFMFEHSAWFQKHVDGYNEYRARIDRAKIEEVIRTLKSRGHKDMEYYSNRGRSYARRVLHFERDCPQVQGHTRHD